MAFIPNLREVFTGQDGRLTVPGLKLLNEIKLANMNSAGITDIVRMTQAEYDAITPDENILYIIIG